MEVEAHAAPDPAPPDPPPSEPPARDRRDRGDRRAHADGGRRGPAKKTSPLEYLLRSLAAIVVLVVVILFAVRSTRPVFATRGTLGEELRKHAPEAAAVLAAADSSPIERFMAT